MAKGVDSELPSLLGTELVFNKPDDAELGPVAVGLITDTEGRLGIFDEGLWGGA